MSIQVFGTKKCKKTQKVIRFFKERSMQFHFIDLKEKSISKGELRSIVNSIPLESLINTESKEYEKRNLKYIQHDIEEVLLENSLLFVTPIVRKGNKAMLGYQPDLLKEWLKGD